MRGIKKFWIIFLSFLPFGAAAMPWLLVGGVIIAGFSIYNTYFPINMADALKFFSSCWTCQMFSDVMLVMSNILPGVYHAIGRVVLPMAVALTAIWFVWKLMSGFLNAKIAEPWNITGMFSVHLVKLAFVCGLLLVPLPRIMSDVALEPIFSVGLSINRLASDTEEFDKCVIATALADTSLVADSHGATRGAYSPWLRYNLACDLASIHQITGLGITSGWTLIRSAFEYRYMHKIMWGIPIFPYIPLICAGFALMVLYLFVLLPIPLYFLEVFIKLSMDLIMLPLMLLAWLFPNWIFPKGRNVKDIIDDVVSGTLGVAMTGVFLMFSLKFMDAAFGRVNGISVLQQAIENNDSHILLDGIMMQNNSMITLILCGIFMAMFMVSIPALVKTLFSVNISQDFYNTARNNFLRICEKLEIPLPDWLKKRMGGNGASGTSGSGGGGGSGGSGSGGGSGSIPSGFTKLNWLKSDGGAFIDTGFVPDDSSGISIEFLPDDSGSRVLAGVIKSVALSDSLWLVGLDSNVFFGWNSQQYANPAARVGGNKCEIKMNWKNDRHGNVDTSRCFDISTPLTSGVAWSVYIFGYNKANTYTSYDVSRDKIIKVMLSKGGRVVHHFYPVRRSDGALGMYDIVTGRFFGNSGRGTFTGG